MAFDAATTKAVQNIFSSSDGKAYMAALQLRYDQTVVRLLTAKPDEVEALRGEARSLYAQMKDIHSCVTAIQ